MGIPVGKHEIGLLPHIILENKFLVDSMSDSKTFRKEYLCDLGVGKDFF